MVSSNGEVVGFALAIFGFVLWTAALTLLLPRALAYGIAFAANRALSRAHLSIGALYCYPLAGLCVVHHIVYADNDAAVSVAKLVIKWRWWRRGRLTAFDDVFDDSGTSAVSKDDESRCATSWSRLWRPIGAFLRSASPLQDDGPAALLSFTCTDLRVRLINMKANYDLLERLRAYAAGDEIKAESPVPAPLDPSHPRKTMVDHLLEYSSLKVTSGALYVCDPGSSPLLCVLFSSAKIRYRHGRPRSTLDLFRFTLSVRVTELKISVADKEMLLGAGVKDPREIGVSSSQTGDAFNQTCMHRSFDIIDLAGCVRGRSEQRSWFHWFRSRRVRDKTNLVCIDLVDADEAYIEYVCDEPGPDVPDHSLSEEPLPPELRCTVELQGASFVYIQKTISCLQDVQERLFPRLFDLTRVAEEFQGRLRRRVPHCFVLEIVANSKGYDESGRRVGESIPLVIAPFTPRSSSWKLLQILGLNRSAFGEQDEDGRPKLPESAISIFTEKLSVHTEIPYKMGDPLHVRADLPEIEVLLQGIVSAPVCCAEGLKVAYHINFPKVWNHVHKSGLDCTIVSGEVTYMADLIRMIDDLTFSIDAQNRKPEDVRYFVPNEFSISIKAVQGVSVKLAASRGNAWTNIYKGLTDEYGMAVLKAEGAELTLDLNAGLEYLPSVVVVEWGLHMPKPTLFLALPCPRPRTDPLQSEEDENARGPSVLNDESQEGLTFAQRVRMLIEMANNVNDDVSTQMRDTALSAKSKRPLSTSAEILEKEYVMMKIAEVGGEVTIKGRGSVHTELFADGVNENRVKVLITGAALDMNPHHIQHYLNVVSNLSAFMNHTVTTEEKHQIDVRRRALAYEIVQDGRLPTFEECVLLGTEGGISLATAAYHTQDRGPAPTAMDETTNISLEVDGGLVMLHNLPNALCSFTEHPSQACSIEIDRVCFALTGNHQEVVSRFAPVPESASFTVYAGQPADLKSNVFRRAQKRRLKEHSLSKYPSVTLSEFLLTRQVLFNKELGAYCSVMDVCVGKVEGCIQETTLLALVAFAKGALIRPPYEEAPVMEALVGAQTVQIRIGRTDVLILCGSQALAIENSAARRKASRDSLPSSSGRCSSRRRARLFVGFLPSAVAGIVQLRLRDGLRFCMSNVASSDVLSRTAVTVPDLSLQLFTPWGGSSTPWKDEATIRAQVSHSSAIKAWRQVGVQQGRPVMHKAGVFENFVMRLVWESHPSLWSDTIHILQRSRLEGADRYSRIVPQLWEVSSSSRQSMPGDKNVSVLRSYNAKWWDFLNLAARREKSSIKHQKTSAVTSMRRDIVSIFVLSRMTLSIGPEALELANYIASKIRNTHGSEQALNNDIQAAKIDNSSPAELIELWRELHALSSDNEDTDQAQGEDRPLRAHGTTVHCNLHLMGASVYLICPFLAEDSIDRSRSHPVIVRDEKVSAGLPNGLQLSYRWRSQRGATGVPSRVEDISAGPTSPSYSISLRQSAFVHVPSVLIETSRKTLSTISNIQGRLADSVTYKRKKRIGVEVSEETHRGSHRAFDVSVSSLNVGIPASDLETYSELGRVFSIYGLMLRALSLDLDATRRWQKERRNASCDAVFGVPYSLLSKLSPTDIRTICFGRQARYLRSQRYIPRIQEFDLIENSFLASQELERNLAMIARGSSRLSINRQYFSANNVITSSISLTSCVSNIVVAICEKEALSIRKFSGEGQFEMVHDVSFALQEPPLVRIGVDSVHVSLHDDIADSGMRTVSSVASYIRFAATYIPMLSYEILADYQDTSGRDDIARVFNLTPERITAHAAQSEQIENLEETPKRNRYSVRSSTRFILRRNVQEHPSEQGRVGKSPRTPKSRVRGRSTEESPRGLTPAHSPISIGYRSTDDHPRSSNFRRPGTPLRSKAAVTQEHEPSAKSDADIPVRASEFDPIDSESSTQNRQNPESANGLKNVLHLYKHPRAEEVSSARGMGMKKGFVVRNLEKKSRVIIDEEDRSAFDHAGMSDSRNDGSSVNADVNVPKSFRSRDYRREHARSSRGDNSRKGRSKTEKREIDSSKISSSHAATIICSVSDVNVSYFRSESSDMFREEPDQVCPDLVIAVNKLRASAVITPQSLHQSVVVTVDDASLRSGNNSNCVLEGSVQSIVSMISIASDLLPSDPKRIIALTRVSGFQLSLRAQDLRSVLVFQAKFKKDIASLASSSLSTRKSLAAMMRATKLENLTRTTTPRASFATIAVDVSFEKVQASLLGFHPADKEMQISYEVQNIFGSFAAMEDSSVTLSLGGLVDGHGLVLSSPSWASNERFDFPTLDARGVQWMHTTGLPTQVKVMAGPLVSSTSFQGLRNVLFTVSGLLAFQNRASFDSEIDVESDAADSRLAQKSDPCSPYSQSNSIKMLDDSGAGLNRSLVAWEHTSAVRMEYSLRPMSVGLVSGDVMAAFETECISGIITWNKKVTTGNQLQAALKVPQFRVTYSRVDKSTHTPDEIRSENSSLLVAIQDVSLDLLKSQKMLTHNFIFRVRVSSVSGHIRPWLLMKDAAVWANEQEVVQEIQAVNSDVALRNRSISSISMSRAEALEEQTEHRVIVLGAEINSVTLAVPLLDSEDSENHRLRVTATEVVYQMRLGNEYALPSQSNLAQLRSHFIGVLWEDAAFLSAHEFEVMFAARTSREGKNAHFGAIRGSCSTSSWIVCPRKDVVLAFLEAKGAPENHFSAKRAITRASEKSSPTTITPTSNDRRQLFQSVEFMILPSQGYIRGLDAVDTFSGNTNKVVESVRTSKSTENRAELSIPTFSIAWLRSPHFKFDLLDVDFSGKNDEFPQDILRKTGNIFSELFGTVATNVAESNSDDASAFSNSPTKPRREIARDWSALVRFGQSRYVAREALTGKLSARLEFYAGRHAGFLASAAANPGQSKDVTQNSTVVCGAAPLLSLKIKPDLEKAMTQALELSFVRIFQGYAPSVAPHTCMHLQGVNASMDVMSILLVREWLKRDQDTSVVRRSDTSSESSSQAIPKSGVVWNSNSVIVLGQPARLSREKTTRESSQVAVRIMLQLSQPDGRVGLLIQRIHFGVAVQKLRNSALGYSTDVDIGIHQIESRANWHYFTWSFKLSRLLFRFEGERAMQEENICGFAAIVNLCTFDFKKGDFDALQLKIDGIAGACRVPDCDLAVQTTAVDASISSSTGKTVHGLLQLSARLIREARRQIESLVLSESRLHDVRINYGIEDSSGPPVDLLLPRSRGDVGHRTQRSQGSRVVRGVPGTVHTRDEIGTRGGFGNATAFLSGDRLSVTMHGYRFQGASGAQLKFLAYELDYKQQSASSYSSRGSTGSSNLVPVTRRKLGASFDLLDVCYITGEHSTSSHSILSMPNPMFEFTVQERGNTAIVDFVTKFDKEIVISSLLSHYDHLINMFRLYAESRVQVRNIVDQFDETGDLRMAMGSVDEVPVGPFGGREVEFKRLVLAPRLQPLGELTPDLDILQRFGIGKEKIPAGVYEFVMMPIAKALEAVTRSMA